MLCSSPISRRHHPWISNEYGMWRAVVGTVFGCGSSSPSNLASPGCSPISEVQEPPALLSVVSATDESGDFPFTPV